MLPHDVLSRLSAPVFRAVSNAVSLADRLVKMTLIHEAMLNAEEVRVSA